MPLNRPVAVIGSAIHYPAADHAASLEEHLYAATQAALKDAGLVIEQIDGIVVGCNDQIDGRAISVMMASGSVGGVDRDILSTPSAGEHAFVMGVLRVASGQFETHLVLAWGFNEATSLAEVERLGADPYFHRRLPLDDLSSFALQAGVVLQRQPQAEAAAAALVEQDLKRGQKAYPGAAADTLSAAAVAGSKPTRWPLRAAMSSAPANGVIALVLACADFVDQVQSPQPAWVRGMGWATEAAFLGDRDLARAEALEAATRQALGESGLAGAASADVIELCGATPYQQLVAAQALGLAEPAQWPAFVAGSGASAALNPSGGLAAVNAIYCGGLARIAEAAAQVRGRAGAHQLPVVNTALAHAASGPAAMYQSVVVFGRAV